MRQCVYITKLLVIYPDLTSSLLGPNLQTAFKKCYASHQNKGNESKEG